MIDFKEELKKYKPALEVDELQNDLNMNEIQDMMELLQYITKKTKISDKE